MIISHKHKFIFLKTNKTAGTSIEIALSRFCGNNDIITPILPEDEKTRIHLGHTGAQNYLVPIWDYHFRDFAYWLLKGKRASFYNHIPAKEVRSRVGEDTWSEYYKFCFERNPWDRVISLYYWKYRSEPRPTISEFLDSAMPLLLKRRGFDVYTIDGEIAVDRVCLFESISDELEGVRRRLGLPEKLDLPQAKSRFRTDNRSYRDILSEEQRDKIGDLFCDEISLFGYQF